MKQSSTHPLITADRCRIAGCVAPAPSSSTGQRNGLRVRNFRLEQSDAANYIVGRIPRQGGGGWSDVCSS